MLTKVLVTLVVINISFSHPVTPDSNNVTAIQTLETTTTTAIKAVKGIITLEPNDEARLMHYLVNSYHGFGLARPVEEVDKTLNVSLLFFINEFLGIDELTGTMQVTATTVAQWQDDLLRWDPEYFNGLEQMPMQTKDIFMPTIVKDGNGGTQASIFMTGSGQNARDINSMVWVDHTGRVEARVTRNYLAACTLDLSAFPFDEQTCDFTFKSWRFNDKRITLHQAFDQKTSEHFGHSEDVNVNVNPHWMMTSISSKDKIIPGEYELFSAISYTIIASRRSDYYIWNVLIPSIAMAVLLLATFFMPFGPGRSMFCITLVLTMNIFQKALTEKLPVTAEIVPFARQTTVQVLMGIAITIESAVVWWIAAKDRLSVVPDLVRKFVPNLRTKIKNEQHALLKAAVEDQVKQDYQERIDKMKRRQGRNVIQSRSTSRPTSNSQSKANSTYTSRGPSKSTSRSNLTEYYKAYGSEVSGFTSITNDKGEEELIIWGEWLEVAQFADLIMLFIAISSMTILPIYFFS